MFVCLCLFDGAGDVQFECLVHGSAFEMQWRRHGLEGTAQQCRWKALQQHACA